MDNATIAMLGVAITGGLIVLLNYRVTLIWREVKKEREKLAAIHEAFKCLLVVTEHHTKTLNRIARRFEWMDRDKN